MVFEPISVGRIRRRVTSTTIPQNTPLEGSYPEKEARPVGGIRPNIITVVLDDASKYLFSAYDDQNAMPPGVPRPNTPWFDEKLRTGIRYTRAFNSPRCSPFRAEAMSGRKAHQSPGHPHGHGISETPNWQSATYGFPGLLAEHRALPSVANAANSGYEHLLVGKWHLHEYDGANSNNAITNRGDVCSVHGFNVFEDSVLSGAGDQYGGYWGFQSYTVDAAGVVTDNGTSATYGAGGPFQGKYLYGKMNNWLTARLSPGAGGDPANPFHIQYWCHMPHGLLPAWDGTGQAPGGGDYTLSFSEAEMVPTANSPEGTIPGGDRDIDGNLGAGGYGPQGRCNVAARRLHCLVEAWDQTMQYWDDRLYALSPEAHANTLWLIVSDNGITGSEATPIKDALFNDSGRFTGTTCGPIYPPTVESYGDGTGTETYDVADESGTPYHNEDHGKGTAYAEGAETPLVVSGPMLPGHMRGTTCGALIESCDWYPTLLDLMAGPVSPLDDSGRTTWQDALGATDLAKIDGVSFYDTFFDISAGARDYAFVQAYSPPGCPVGEEVNIARGLINRAGWRLVHSMVEPATTVTKELYDLNNDRSEANDLYGVATVAVTDPTYNATAAENLADLEAELARRLA